MSDKKCVSEINVNNAVVTDGNRICNVFNEYFVNIPCKLQRALQAEFNNQQQVCTMNSSIPRSIVMLPASTNEIGNYIRGMKSSSSAGTDLIPSKFLKHNVDIFLPTFTTFLNRSVLEGVFPDQLKKARVTPIHKKGQKSSVDNYSPISILSNLSKPFEKLIHSRLLEFFSRNNIINENQYGFQPRSNTTSAVVSLVNNVQINIDQKKICSAIFVDISKAF